MILKIENKRVNKFSKSNIIFFKKKKILKPNFSVSIHSLPERSKKKEIK